MPTIPGGSLGTFRNGLQSLPLKVKEILGDQVRFSHKLVDISQEGGKWVSTFETPTGTKIFRSNALLITAPAHAIANVVSKSVLPEAAELAKVNYPPVASVTIAYPNEAFKVIEISS